MRAMSSTVSSPHKNLEKFKRIMDHVYGEFTTTTSSTSSSSRTTGHWTPKLYKEYTTGGGGGRYLWTDAYGVINYITLFCETNNAQYLDQADALIDQVHDILGRERSSSRSSSSSSSSLRRPARLGASTDEQPTLGGLRIGKNAEEVSDDGDGQYFHYLTKWMYCLNRMSVARNDEKYNQWAIDLAKSIHPAFVHKASTGSRPRMFWKMSIDLKRPLVHSEGNLDPFDGYLTYRILQDTNEQMMCMRNGNENRGGATTTTTTTTTTITPDYNHGGVLDREIHDMKLMVDTKYPHYASNDPLDLGEALWISHWYHDEIWSHHISKESLGSINELWDHGYFHSRSYYRLAFREFGTTIGVQVNPIVERKSKEWITNRVPLLHAFWEKDLFSRDSNITPIMYCSSLIPGAWRRGYVEEHMDKQRSES